MCATKRLKTAFVWRWAAAAFILIGLALGTIAIIIAHDRQTEPKPPSGDLTARSAPSSVKLNPEAVASYSVPSANPKYLAIPAIDIGQTRIMQLGRAKDNEISVPDNIYDAGWYEASARPGQNGAMFIYGHVSNWKTDGVFYNLKKLKSGDKVIITGGDNKTFTYLVVATKVYPYKSVDMNSVLAPINPSKPGLNLMTCTGTVIKGTSEFSERLVVFTSQVKN